MLTFIFQYFGSVGKGQTNIFFFKALLIFLKQSISFIPAKTTKYFIFVVILRHVIYEYSIFFNTHHFLIFFLFMYFFFKAKWTNNWDEQHSLYLSMDQCDSHFFFYHKRY